MGLSLANAKTPNSERDRVRRAQEADSCVDVRAHEPYRVYDGYREGDEKENYRGNYGNDVSGYFALCWQVMFTRLTKEGNKKAEMNDGGDSSVHAACLVVRGEGRGK
jgi:hypothetical protein